MPAALLLALGQIGDPAFRRPLLWGVLGAAVAAGLLVWGAIEGAAWAAGGTGWLSWLAQAGGGALGLILAWWLFLPLTAAIAAQLVDPVAAAVERRHYPRLPPARGRRWRCSSASRCASACALCCCSSCCCRCSLCPWPGRWWRC